MHVLPRDARRESMKQEPAAAAASSLQAAQLLGSGPKRKPFTSSGPGDAVETADPKDWAPWLKGGAGTPRQQRKPASPTHGGELAAYPPDKPSSAPPSPRRILAAEAHMRPSPVRPLPKAPLLRCLSSGTGSALIDLHSPRRDDRDEMRAYWTLLARPRAGYARDDTIGPAKKVDKAVWNRDEFLRQTGYSHSPRTARQRASLTPPPRSSGGGELSLAAQRTRLQFYWKMGKAIPERYLPRAYRADDDDDGVRMKVGASLKLR